MTGKTPRHTTDYKYYINRYGEKVMRISEIIGSLSKQQLVAWANKLGLEGVKYKDELKRTANIGKMCHHLIESYIIPNSLVDINFEEFDISSNDDAKLVRKLLESFISWFTVFSAKVNFNLHATELTLVGDYFGGTLDTVIDGFNNPNAKIIVDYKTSSGIYLSHFLQLSGYVILWEELYPKIPIEGIMVILLDKKSNKTRAEFISRKNMKTFIELFWQLYYLTASLKSATRDIREMIIKY